MKQLYYVIQTLLRGRGSNIIKIISLGLGLTMSILLFARVAYEQSFDKCFKDYDNLYQIFSIFSTENEKGTEGAMNCGPVAGAILENFPKEVEAATSFCRWMTSPLYNGNNGFDIKKIQADSLFFRTMGIEVLSGNPEKDLMQNDIVFLSHSLAQQMFGNEDPIGKVITYDKTIKLTVKGTYEDIPENATVNPEAVISLPTIFSHYGRNSYSWSGGDSWFEYIRFRAGADKEIVHSRLDAMIQKYRPAEDKKTYNYTAVLHPIRDTYSKDDDVRRMGKIMSILGFAILFIAALNYVLISISSLTYRAKSVGVHKCSGANGSTVFGMFLIETGIVISAALVLMGLMLFYFREFIEDTICTKLEMLFTPDRIWVPLAVVGMLFLIGGVLPGRIFASIPVTQVFRRYTEGKKGWKRPLLFIQFAGVAFICGLMYVVMAQYQYVLNKDTGYNAKRVAYGYFPIDDRSGSDAALHLLQNLPYVESVSSASNPPFIGLNGMMIQDEGGKKLFSSRYLGAMENYPVMMGMTMKAGRMARDKNEVVVNETFAQWMRWGKEVVGRTVYAEGDTYKVVGLLKDFQLGSFYSEQKPLIMQHYRYFGECAHLRLKEPFVENLRKLNEEAANAFSERTVSFSSMEQSMTENYNSVRVFRNATLLSAVTMFFIMLMGLIGYTSDEVRRRSKEIAIRKVNGAEVSSVLELLSKDVLYVAVPAVLVGALGAWYINEIWMDQFAERVPIYPTVYLLVVIANLVVIVGCVLWKSWEIANENPVNSIKSE